MQTSRETVFQSEGLSRGRARWGKGREEGMGQLGGAGVSGRASAERTVNLPLHRTGSHRRALAGV